MVWQSCQWCYACHVNRANRPNVIVKFYARLGLALTLSMSAWVVLASQLGRALPSPQLAFLRAEDRQTDIYLLDLRTQVLLRLTDTAAPEFNPVWSPDGTRLLYQSAATGAGDLYLFALPGRKTQQVTNYPTNDFDPEWLPDGTHITFSSVRNNNQDVFVARAGGAEIDNGTRISTYDGLDYHPTASPDGRYIAYTSQRAQGFVIYVYDRETGAEAMLQADTFATSPAWSPDGTTIAFGARRERLLHDLYIVRPDGGGERRLTQSAGYEYNPAWSPDACCIAFVLDENGIAQLWVVDIASGRQMLLTDAIRADSVVAWLPDSSGIAFAGRGHFAELYKVTLDGSLTRLTTLRSVLSHPVWRPTVGGQ